MGRDSVSMVKNEKRSLGFKGKKGETVVIVAGYEEERGGMGKRMRKIRKKMKVVE